MSSKLNDRNRTNEVYGLNKNQVIFYFFIHYAFSTSVLSSSLSWIDTKASELKCTEILSGSVGNNWPISSHQQVQLYKLFLNKRKDEASANDWMSLHKKDMIKPRVSFKENLYHTTFLGAGHNGTVYAAFNSNELVTLKVFHLFNPYGDLEIFKTGDMYADLEVLDTTGKRTKSNNEGKMKLTFILGIPLDFFSKQNFEELNFARKDKGKILFEWAQRKIQAKKNNMPPNDYFILENFVIELITGKILQIDPG